MFSAAAATNAHSFPPPEMAAAAAAATSLAMTCQLEGCFVVLARPALGCCTCPAVPGCSAVSSAGNGGKDCIDDDARCAPPLAVGHGGWKHRRKREKAGDLLPPAAAGSAQDTAADTTAVPPPVVPSEAPAAATVAEPGAEAGATEAGQDKSLDIAGRRPGEGGGPLSGIVLKESKSKLHIASDGKGGFSRGRVYRASKADVSGVRQGRGGATVRLVTSHGLGFDLMVRLLARS